MNANELICAVRLLEHGMYKIIIKMKIKVLGYYKLNGDKSNFIIDTKIIDDSNLIELQNEYRSIFKSKITIKNGKNRFDPDLIFLTTTNLYGGYYPPDKAEKAVQE